MDKSRKEKDGLYDIACRHQRDYYTENIDIKESYFIKREEEPYIREYGFETLPELKKELELMWKEDIVMQECIQTVLVSALKMKPTAEVEGEPLHTEKNKSEKLPGYIYNF